MFMREIIHNICSETACRKQLLPFASALQIFLKSEDMSTLTKACSFLKSFFDEYQKTAKESGLNLPKFLQNGMNDIVLTYNNVAQIYENDGNRELT